jgi:hypothetical protein
LMMGIRIPETCWAVFKRQAINLLLIAASNWLIHLNVWRCTDLQTPKLWCYSLPARELNISTNHLHLCQCDLSPFYNFLYLTHIFIFSCIIFWQCKLQAYRYAVTTQVLPQASANHSLLFLSPS